MYSGMRAIVANRGLEGSDTGVIRVSVRPDEVAPFLGVGRVCDDFIHFGHI